MEEHDGVKREGWEERYADPSDKSSNPDNTFAYVIRYNDGTVVTKYYRRGEEGVKNTETTEDPVQKKAWADQQKTSGAAAQESISAPSNQAVIIRTGPKDAEHPDGIYQIPNPNYVKPTGSATNIQDQNGVRTTTKTAGGVTDTLTEPAPKSAGPQQISAPSSAPFILQQQPDGTITKEPNPNYDASQQAKYQAVKQDENSGKWFGLKSDGTFEEIQGGPGKAPEKPSFVDLPTGGKGQLVDSGRKDARGNPIYEATPVEGTAPPQTGGTPPGITPGASLGSITNSFNNILQQIWNDPKMTWAQKEAAANLTAKLHEGLANETSTILTSQQNTLSNQTSQRNQDVADQTNRRAFAANLQQNAFENTAKLAPYAPAGSDIAGNAYLGQLMLGFKLADAMGALKLPERIQPGAAAQQVYGTGLPQVGNTTTIKPDGTTVIQHAPAPPASVQAAVPAPQPPPQQNYSDMALAPGAAMSGGQLAVRNPEDMPSWLSGWGQ